MSAGAPAKLHINVGAAAFNLSCNSELQGFQIMASVGPGPSALAAMLPGRRSSAAAVRQGPFEIGIYVVPLPGYAAP